MTQQLQPARATASSTPTLPQATDPEATTGAKHPSDLSILGVITVLIGVFLSMVDFFIVNVALPSIEQSLNASSATLELIVAGYGIAYALLLVLGGRLGDAFGRKRLFLAGMTAFGVTSLLCGLAPTAGTLVLARIAQGAAAAAMVPQVLATIQATTTGHHRARAIGMYGAAGGIAAVAGQLLGGVLISADIAGTGWRLIFLVNVPVVVIGLVLAVRMIPETRSAMPQRPDIVGTALLGLTVLTLLIPLTEGRSTGWPWWTWVLLALAPMSATAFVAVERRKERAGGLPLVPPSLLKVPSMRNGLLVTIPFFVGFGGFMFIYAVTVQQGAHLSPLQAGFALVPMGLTFLIASLASERLVARYGRRVIGAGAVMQAVGLSVLVVSLLRAWPEPTTLNLALGMAIAGAGQGLIISPLFRVVLSAVPAERAGVGSGVLITTQQVSMALGVAMLGSLFLSLSEMPEVKIQHAFVAVVFLQILMAVIIAVTSRRLPAVT